MISVRNRYPEFNQNFQKQLEQNLHSANVHYIYLGKESGGRPVNLDVYIDGKLNAVLLQTQPLFIRGIRKILALCSTGAKMVLMCVERSADQCHRKTIVTPILEAADLEVIHIK